MLCNEMFFSSSFLQWNIADYLNQHQSVIQSELETLRKEDSTPSTFSSPFLQALPHSSLPVFDSVWMLLFTTLSELCINERSAIRKSAAQTLFSALSAHGSLLQPSTWQAVLWQVKSQIPFNCTVHVFSLSLIQIVQLQY